MFMNRREMLRQGALGLTVTGVGTLAGCAGEDEAEAEGTVTNDIDELSVESTTVRDDTGPRYVLDARITNTGDRTVELSSHTMELALFGEGGEDLAERAALVDYPNRASEPGETREVQFRVDVTTDAQDVTRWELNIYCDDSFDDSGYCA